MYVLKIALIEDLWDAIELGEERGYFLVAQHSSGARLPQCDSVSLSSSSSLLVCLCSSS